MSGFAVVTVIHNSRPDLGRLLGSVERHLEPAPQVIVVDSGSEDDGATLARERGAELVELPGNLGFGAGCNAGLERVTEAVTALVNPDVELLDAGLGELARDAAERDVLLAPRLVGDDGSTQDSAHARPGTAAALLPAILPRPLLPRPLRVRAEPWRSEEAREVGWAVGACLVARTDLFRRLGPFDPEVFLFYEDMDLCLRAADLGVPTLLRPEVTVRHSGGTSTGRALGNSDLELRARRRREVLRRRGRAALVLDDAAEALTFGLRAAAKRLAGRRGETERAKLRALRAARRERP